MNEGIFKALPFVEIRRFVAGIFYVTYGDVCELGLIYINPFVGMVRMHQVCNRVLQFVCVCAICASVNHQP